MKRLICAAIAALGGIAATSFAGTAGSAGQLLVVGPVETVDFANSTATVLGQRVYTTSLSGLTVGSGLPISFASGRSMTSTSTGMSSGRSRNGGMRTRTTFSR